MWYNIKEITREKRVRIMSFSAVFRPGMEDLRAGLLVRNRSLLRFCEDTAGFHSDSAGIGLAGLDGMGSAWVLLAWNLAVTERPRYGTELTVTTWVRETNRVHCWRDFLIRDPDGRLLAEAASRWIIVRKEDHAILPIPPSVSGVFPPEPAGSLAGWKARRLPEMTEPEEETTRMIDRSRTDMLGHLHNLGYLDLAEDMIPEALGDPGLIDAVTLRFKNEVRAGEKVSCLRTRSGDGQRVDVMGPRGLSASVCFGREL